MVEHPREALGAAVMAQPAAMAVLGLELLRLPAQVVAAVAAVP